MLMASPESSAGGNFIREIVEQDIQTGRHRRLVTRFPPEPNGYLHIGHAKSICLNFGLAQAHPGSVTHLRFDDTNPSTENVEYVASIQSDVRWLGFDWGDRLFYASDYFDRLYEYARQLIANSLAYVDSLSAEEIRAYRGTLTEPGRDSPHRTRSVEENLDLFARMKAGEFPDGAHVLRATITMASPNINLRDPTLYRIRHVTHHRTGETWKIYPTYDYAHPISDAIEGITHSICTLEFEDHRPLYNWLLEHLDVPCQPRPRQIEFARLNLTHTVMSKRRLLELVGSGAVTGWDDPRLPTLQGLRRRGYTPEAIRAFCEQIGVQKRDGTIAMALLEHVIREDLNHRALRVMAVLRPLKVVIENYPEGQTEDMVAVNHPDDPHAGTRRVPFSRVLYIEQDDFREVPPKKFFRLTPGQEVRLRYAYLITCVGIVKDERTGEVVEVRCTYDSETKSGGSQAGRKVKGTIHWVSAAAALDAEARLYDHLFAKAAPDDVPEGQDYRVNLNPASLERLTGCKVEPSLAGATPGSRYQFERQGYFCVDTDSTTGRLVFNRTVALRDSWAKIEKAHQA